MSSTPTRQLLERYLGTFDLRGNEFIFDCPFCVKKGYAEVKRKLHVNIENNLFHCFRCDVGGKSLNQLVYLLTGKVQTEHEEIKYFKEEVTKTVNDIFEKDCHTDLWGMEADLEEGFISLSDASGTTARKAKEYLHSRGLTNNDIIFYNIHYGFTGKYTNSVVFPVYLNDILVFYTARSFITNEKIHPNKLSAPTGKAGCLFNYDHAKNCKDLIITEGVFDSISCGKNAVCLFGKKASDKQLDLILESNAINVIICLDPDAKEDAIELLKKISPYKTCKMIDLEEGDANDHRDAINEKFKNNSHDNNLKSLVQLKLRKVRKATKIN